MYNIYQSHRHNNYFVIYNTTTNKAWGTPAKDLLEEFKNADDGWTFQKNTDLIKREYSLILTTTSLEALQKSHPELFI